MNQVFKFSILLLSLYSCNLSAVQDIADLASHIYEPVSVAIQLVRAISIICGVGLLLGGIFRYIEYRRNPVVVRLSMVVSMFLFGGVLIIVGLLQYVPY